MRASTAVLTVLLDVSPALWPELGDRAGTAAARGNLGLLTTAQGGYARAMVLCEEDLAGDRDLEDRHGAGQPRACPLPFTLLDLGQRCACAPAPVPADAPRRPTEDDPAGAGHMGRASCREPPRRGRRAPLTARCSSSTSGRTRRTGRPSSRPQP
jgi:hypothetical protein